MAEIRIGLETLLAKPETASNWGRCGILANQASMTAKMQSAWDVCRQVLGKNLVSYFGPQHGFFGTVQDNMIETPHEHHPDDGRPIYSLYSKIRKPSQESMTDLDTLVVDLQITGTRIYTFKATVALCLQACAEYGKKLVILDRPNPIGGLTIEGHVLQRSCFSFVGPHAMPMRHGLTMGEAATLFNQWIKADLEVVPLEGWQPQEFFHKLQRPWIITSPNMPLVDTAMVYPGFVMLEGTNLSEGRGTCLPFQIIGAPYLKNGQQFIKRLCSYLPKPIAEYGVHLRPCEFMPTFHKWAGQVCHGMQVHVQQAEKVQSFELAIATMRAAIDIGGNQFAFKAPPYEYEYHDVPMRFIFGAPDIVDRLLASDFDLRDEYWHLGHAAYIEEASKILLYPRELKSSVA